MDVRRLCGALVEQAAQSPGMNVLVTGGTGFLGSHLIEQLTRQGDSVRALSRGAQGDEYLRSLGATPVRGDLDDAQSLEPACQGCRVVYHCAAKVELFGDKHDFHQANVAGTQRLIEAAGRSGVRRFVHVSSCAVYLNMLSVRVVAAGKLIDEFTPVTAPPSWYRYGQTKYESEQVVQARCSAPMQWTIVRLGHLYGPRDRRTMSYVVAALNDSRFRMAGDGSNELTLVYVEDAARALVLSARRAEAANTILVVVPNSPCTQRAYLDALADGLGLPRATRYLPFYLAFGLSWLGEYLVRGGPRRAWLRRSFVAILGLPAKITGAHTSDLLGWAPQTTLAEGMKRTFEWYRAEYGKPDPQLLTGMALRPAADAGCSRI